MPKTKPRYVYVTYINTTPRKLWRALTDTALIRQYWVGRTNTSTWKKGAGLESRSPDGELEWAGKILESRPPHRLVYTFRMDGAGQPVTKVTCQIDKLGKNSPQRGKGLRLTVTHEGYAPGSPQLEGISTGWPVILSGLKTLVETGKGLGITWVDGD